MTFQNLIGSQNTETCQNRCGIWVNRFFTDCRLGLLTLRGGKMPLRVAILADGDMSRRT